MSTSDVTQFQIAAALWVVRAVDRQGTDKAALESAFRNAVTQGRFPRLDLDNAHRLLMERGLLHDMEGRVEHQGSLWTLLALPDETALPFLETLLAPSRGFEDEIDADLRRAKIGALGEEAVVTWCVDEFVALGHHELVGEVQRVSLVSDRFGFDVTAPTIGAEVRMLEVKTSTSGDGKTFRFFLTRNEYDIGRRHPRAWAMVACTSNGKEAAVVGWCRASELERYLPDDVNGRWTEAQVNLPRSALLAGAPSALS